jgi:hypothetical protein
MIILYFVCVCMSLFIARYIYVIAGFTISTGIAAVECFDTHTPTVDNGEWQWKLMAPLPRATAVGTCITVHDGILYAGMFDARSML